MIAFEIVGAFLKQFWPWIAGAIAIAVAVWGWNHYVWTPHVKDPYIAQGVAQEHLNTVKAEARAVAAEGANASLQADVGQLRARVQMANDATAAITKQELDLAVANKVLRAQMAAKDSALDAERQRFAAAAAAPPAPTPVAACSKADALSAEYSARRLGSTP